MAASGVPRFASCFFAISTAFGVSVRAALASAEGWGEVALSISMMMSRLDLLGRLHLGGFECLAGGALALEVLDGALDGILRQNRAVHFHRRQVWLLHHERVPDFARLFHPPALPP